MPGRGKLKVLERTGVIEFPYASRPSPKAPSGSGLAYYVDERLLTPSRIMTGTACAARYHQKREDIVKRIKLTDLPKKRSLRFLGAGLTGVLCLSVAAAAE